MKSRKIIAGVDEVGRGSLIGSVYSAAVILPANGFSMELRDSKKLTGKSRTKIANRLIKESVCISIGIATKDEIDCINIHHATLLSMRRAVYNLVIEPDLVLIDGGKGQLNSVLKILNKDLRKKFTFLSISKGPNRNEKYDFKLLEECSPRYVNTTCKVFINGAWIGVTAEPIEFKKLFILHRRNGLFNIYTSLYWNIELNEIHIQTDAGRPCHPLCYLTGNEISFEKDNIIAFNDINPKSPVHVLIIPKIHIATLNDLIEEHKRLIGELVFTAKYLAEDLGIDEAGYRLNFKCNPAVGQTVYHIHLHLMGGREFGWPPG